MKRIVKTIISVLLLFCICMPLLGCNISMEELYDSCFFYSAEKNADDEFFGVNQKLGIAFRGPHKWDGGDMSFVVSDEFMGYKVTALGGYIGRGNPIAFRIGIDAAKLYNTDTKNTYMCSTEIFEVQHLPDDEYDILTFSVHLGKNMEKIKYVRGKIYYAHDIKGKDGQIKHDFLCKIVYYFTVDEDNPTFYAQDGKLFYRENNKLVTDFFYE